MFKGILHATDLKENHLEYCEQAAKLAKIFDAELYFIHVLDLPASWQIAQSLGFAENEPLPIEETKMILNVLGEQFSLPPENLLLMEGSRKHKIIECIHELQIDLLLIGSGSNPLLQGELTHLTHYLGDHAPCNVLLMRSK
jgi:nucleotide-binding universal stress UspA family protein